MFRAPTLLPGIKHWLYIRLCYVIISNLQQSHSYYQRSRVRSSVNAETFDYTGVKSTAYLSRYAAVLYVGIEVLGNQQVHQAGLWERCLTEEQRVTCPRRAGETTLVERALGRARASEPAPRGTLALELRRPWSMGSSTKRELCKLRYNLVGK